MSVREDRTGSGELSVARCWALLRTTSVGRIAAVVDDRVSIRPVNIAVDHGSLLLRTAHGTWASRLPGRDVVVEADGLAEGLDDAGGTHTYAWSVLARGVARRVAGYEDLLSTHEVPLLPWQGDPKPLFIRIEATDLTGRQFRVADPARWAEPMTEARRAPKE